MSIWAIWAIWAIWGSKRAKWFMRIAKTLTSATKSTVMHNLIQHDGMATAARQILTPPDAASPHPLSTHLHVYRTSLPTRPESSTFASHHCTVTIIDTLQLYIEPSSTSELQRQMEPE
ncbi:hypothetical protein K504DRAFT_500194 [Pleomassaria siparia CBS 279.74]|uniref:Secreted protein n=1 Tax=Pleomassaria siparia CBS 279.74 TaxID=1314801 RepID=A0A6G1KFX4_9PLEO|nr:hypothetical protein K504DRAFT_500194 [Pleomassaria siparia CBS 279.74]